MFCRCIKTFEVEFSPDHKEFSRINHQDTIFTSYVYSPGKALSRATNRSFLACWLTCLHVSQQEVTINPVTVLYSRGGGERLVQSEGCGLLGSTRSILAAGDVYRGPGRPG